MPNPKTLAGPAMKANTAKRIRKLYSFFSPSSLGESSSALMGSSLE
jgi:hypothetical protein